MTYTIFRLSDGARTETGLDVLPSDLDEESFGWRSEPSVNPDQYIWDAGIPGYTDATAPVIARNLTKLEFQRLFTRAERIAIRASTDPIVGDALAMQLIAEDINLQDIDTVQGINYLATLGLIESVRAAQILAGEAPDSE